MKTACLSYGSKHNGWFKMNAACKENGCLVFNHQ